MVEISEILNLFSNNEKLFKSETQNKITFEETFKVCEIDDSISSKIPNSRYITIDFYLKKDDDRILGVNSTEDIKKLNGSEYRTKQDVIQAIINVKKQLFSEVLERENLLIYYKLDSFISQLDRINWEYENEKLIILILNNKKIKFMSDFIHIENYNREIEILNSIIEEDVKKRYEEFNNIYSAVYDDKKLENYFEYPLTWVGKSDSEIPDIISKKILMCFFKIICNKSLSQGRYLIRGQKTVILQITDEIVPQESVKIIDELFEFLLDVDKHHDKLTLLRNTLTVYLNSQSDTKNFIDEAPEIIKSLKYNFELYIQEKVYVFLDQKNKLLQEYIGVTKKIEDMTAGLVAQIRTITLSLMGTIFLSLLGDINKSKTFAILNLALISYILYFSVNIVLIGIQRFQKDALLKSLKNYTKELGVIGEQSDNNLSYHSLKEKYLQKSLEIYNIYWTFILVSVIILIVVFILIYLSLRFDYLPQLKTFIKFIIGYS